MSLKRVFTLLCVSLSMFVPVQASEIMDGSDYEYGLECLNRGEYKDAFRCFGIASKQGDTRAQYELGLMFLDGLGITPNPIEAAYWFRKAAQNGLAEAQFEIGCCFRDGVGVQKDDRIAAEWFWRAAQQNDPDAALFLARMYRDGIGMAQDFDKARRYFHIAIDNGIDEAVVEMEQLPATNQSTNNNNKQRNKRR